MKLSVPLLEAPNRVIAIYIAATLVLTSIALLFWLTGFSDRHSELLKFVYFEPAFRGGDLTNDARFNAWHEQGAFVLQKVGTMQLFNFCPFAFFVIIFFLNLPHPVAALAAFVAAVALVYAAFLARALAPNRLALLALFTALCTSYPFGFLFERGNIEGVVWIPTVLTVYFFARARYLASALALAVACSIKPFPSMLFLLLLSRRRYREILIGVVAIAAISTTSLAIIGPDFATALRENLKGFQLIGDQYVFPYRMLEVGHDHSLFSFVKQIVRLLLGWPLQETLSGTNRAVYPYYVVLACLIFCASIFRLRKLPTLNQIFGICVLMILISPVNNDYTLIAIYIPWAILLLALSHTDCAIRFKPSVLLMVLCAVIFTPQGYMLLGSYAAFGAQVKTAALCGILLLSVIYPLPVGNLDQPQSA